MDAAKVIKQVRKIEITTKQLVDGLIAGNYHSVFRGSGIEFSDIREYIQGDDVRAIDWNVTARLNKPFIKEFIEERDLRIYFAFDISGSSNFGNLISKKEKAVNLIAALMFSALKNNDNIGLLLFTDKIEQFIPARKGKKHVLKILSILLSKKPESRGTDISHAIGYLSKVARKKSIIFLVSDFQSPDYKKQLKILKNKHDVIAINIFDIREIAIPDVGVIALEDYETGEQLIIDSSDPEFREAYLKEMEQYQDSVRNKFKKLKIDCIDIITEEAYEVPLKRFFKMRKQRMVS